MCYMNQTCHEEFILRSSNSGLRGRHRSIQLLYTIQPTSLFETVHGSGFGRQTMVLSIPRLDSGLVLPPETDTDADVNIGRAFSGTTSGTCSRERFLRKSLCWALPKQQYNATTVYPL